MRTSLIPVVLLTPFVVGCTQTTSPVDPGFVSPGSSVQPTGASGILGAGGSTGIQARVNAVLFAPSVDSASVTVEIFIPHGINAAAREHGAPFGIQASVAYTSAAGPQTLDSGPQSIANDTTTFQQLNKSTDIIHLVVPFGGLPTPQDGSTLTGTASIFVMR